MKINSIVMSGLLISSLISCTMVTSQATDAQKGQPAASKSMRAVSPWSKRLCQKEGDPCQENFMAVCPGDKFAQHIVFKGTCDEKLKCAHQKSNCPVKVSKDQAPSKTWMEWVRDLLK